MSDSEIQVLDGVVPPELVKDLRRACEGLIYRYGWKSQVHKPWPGHWNATVLVGGYDNTEDISGGLANFQPPYDAFRAYWAWLHLESTLFSAAAVLLRYYSNISTYGTDGYPHTDSKREGEASAILYLNHEWEPEWAGATAIWTAAGWDIERAVMPKPGRLVIFPGNRLHAAWAVSRICPVERRVLVLKVRR